MICHRIFSVVFFACLIFACVPAGGENQRVIGNITITGNKTTRDFVIYRELSVKTGDTLFAPTMEEVLTRNRNQVFNTRLFNFVEILRDTSIPGWIFLEIKVTERWYIWPVPVIQFADRNFNVWYETKRLDRLNYGVYFHHYNFRGRREILKLSLLNGYTKTAGLDYDIPFIGNNKKIGIHFDVYYQNNREIWYNTRNNRLEFYFDDHRSMIRNFRFNTTFLYRPKVFNKNYFTLGFSRTAIGDTIVTGELNAHYLANGAAIQNAILGGYTFIHDRRDVAYYPLQGHFLQADAENYFFTGSSGQNYAGIIRVNAEKFWRISRHNFAAVAIRTKTSFPEKQPYYLTRAFGYKEFVRGFEPFVIDGPHALLIKTNYKIGLFQKGLIHFPFVPLEQFNRVPFSVYLNIYADAGYVRDPRQDILGNTYKNRWLSGSGVGLDIITYYDRILRVEYSINNFGKKGLYLHFTAPI